MRDICWFDFETGGLDHQTHSPLSFAMIQTRGHSILNEWKTEIRELPLVVDPEALKINRIDLTEPGLNFEKFRLRYQEKINLWFYGGSQEYGEPRIRPNKSNMPAVGGQNIEFDNRWLHRILGSTWTGIYYHGIDLMRLAYPLVEIGILKQEPDLKLASLCRQLGVEVSPEKLHDCLEDVRATFRCYLKIRELFTPEMVEKMTERLRSFQPLESKNGVGQAQLHPH
jgi:DNA polymerase III epsilon subunit-like protein